MYIVCVLVRVRVGVMSVSGAFLRCRENNKFDKEANRHALLEREGGPKFVMAQNP